MAKNLRAKFREEKWSNELKEKDKLLMRRKTYFLPGSAISSSVECQASPCSYKQDSTLDKSLSSNLLNMTVSAKKYPMMICFSCNRTYHCICVGMTVEKLKIEPVPYTCPECTTNENNEPANAYYASRKWSDGMKSRRREVLCPTAVVKKPFLLDEQVTDDDLDPADESSMNSSLFQTVSNENTFGEIGTVPISMFQQQVSEMQEMNKCLVKAEVKNEELNIRLRELEKQVTEQEELKKKFVELQRLVESMKEQQQARTKVKIVEQSQIIPSTVLSSTAFPKILTVKEMLAQNYLSKKARTAVPVTISMSSTRHEDVGNSTIYNGSNGGNYIEIEQGESSRSNMRNLSASESILLEQAEITREASRAQREMTSTMSLELRRKSLPKIGKFSGDPKDWIRFKRDVKRYQEIGKFDDDLMKMYILQSLEGIALERVQDMIDTSPLGHTMKMLEEGFGESSRIIEKCSQDILNLRLEKDLYRDDVMIINTKIQAYFSACIYAKIDYANTNQLAKHIFDQFSPHNKQFFRHYFRSSHPNDTTKLIDLESIFGFLEDLANDLEDKKLVKKDEKPKIKPASIMVTSLTNIPSKPRGSDDYMYEIRDKETAPFIGYDMSAVSAYPKACELCESEQHYTVECQNYKAMDQNEKVRLISEKGLCRNCVITNSHLAADCNVKALCGYRNGNSRCTQKHHITLHKALSYNPARQNVPWNGNRNFNRPPKRNGTQWNMERANNILKNSGTSQHNNNNQVENPPQQQPQQSNAVVPPANVSSVAPSINELPHINQNRNFGNNATNTTAQIHTVNAPAVTESQRYRPNINVVPYSTNRPQVMNISCVNVDSTVKVFKNVFLGKDGYVIGHSVGDSAAEVTLVREDLRKALGIEGEKCQLELQWTDTKSRKMVDAVKIDLYLQGLQENAEQLILRNCYAINNLDLPQRSLDMDRLKQKFAYLNDVEFESYENVSPWLIIGSPHAAVIENIGKLRQDGVGKPVGLLAKLGWCVYGGNDDEDNQSQDVKQGCGRDATLVNSGCLEEPRNIFSATEKEKMEVTAVCSPWNKIENGTSRNPLIIKKKKENVRNKWKVISSLLPNSHRPCLPRKFKLRKTVRNRKWKVKKIKEVIAGNATLPNLSEDRKAENEMKKFGNE